MRQFVLCSLTPKRIVDGEHVEPQEPHHGQGEACGVPAVAHGQLAARLPCDHRGVRPAHFQGDFRSRVPEPHDEDAPLPELARIPVFAGVKLDDGRIQPGRKVRQPGRLRAAGRHNDVAGFPPAAVGHRDEPPLFPP